MNRFSYIYITLLCLCLAILPSCKYLSDSKLAMAYHNTTARYNGYFNAKEKMKEDENRLFDEKVDNYNKVLDVFTVTDDKNAKSYAGDMDLVTKKCSKVIYKHDRSKWIKNCYLLMGKSSFYKRDYFTALETFGYVSEKYKKTPIGQEAGMWMVRCYLELKKLNDAQAQLGLVHVNKKIDPKLEPYLHLIEADYDIKVGPENYAKAIDHLEKAIPHVHKKKYKTRYMFILAQLYQRVGKADKSVYYYKQVIKRNPVYDLSFQARLGLADVSNNPKEVLRYLGKLTRDDKNTTYYDQIYYAMARTEMRQNNVQGAIADLNKSVRASKTNRNQKALSYLMLADIYFKQPVYPAAKAYYDSAGKFFDADFPGAEQNKARQAVLSDLITNLITLQREDSLLRLSALDSVSLRNKINQVVQDEQQKAIQGQQAQQAAQSQNTQAFPGMRSSIDSIGTSQAKEGYFTRNETIALGRSEFVSRWGDRPRQDNWRVLKTLSHVDVPNVDRQQDNGQSHNNKGDLDTMMKSANSEPVASATAPGVKPVPVQLQKYYMYIPFTQSQKALSNRKIQEALYAIGNIYYQHLNDYNKAIEAFEELLRRYPNADNAPAAAYNLWRIYGDMKNDEKKEYYRKYVLDHFPGSTYAQLIEHPEALSAQFVKSKSNERLEAMYARAYSALQSGDCRNIKLIADSANSSFSKNYLRPKFEYIHMLCMGKNDSAYHLVDSLKAFTKKYPGDAVTTQAMSVIKYLETQPKKPAAVATGTAPNIPGLHIPVANTLYKKDTGQEHIFVIAIPMTANADVVKTSLSNYNMKHHVNEQHDITASQLDSMQIVRVMNFTNYDQAQAYMNELSKEPGFYSDMALPSHQEFIISDANLSAMFKNHDLKGYLKFYKDNYL